MTAWLLPVLAGFCTGILSAWGVGGGTLLLLLMTLFLGVEQADAMAINLLYFLPTAAMGLLYHRKNGLLERAVLRTAAPWGTAAAAAGALAATAVDVSLLRRPFGLFLLAAAVLIPVGCETLQLLFGRSFDVDDLICNFIGSVIGAAVAFAIRKVQPAGQERG